MMDERMRIGEVAERAGVTPRTIRYYESIGLLPPGEREGTGHHHYTEATLERLRKIDQLKKLGLSLEEIQGVIDLYFSDTSGIQGKRKVLAILRGHLADADAKIAALQGFRAEVRANIARMEGYLADAQPG